MMLRREISAIRKKGEPMNRDMTQGKPFSTILWFALPLFIGSVFQLFYNMVDSIVVGRFVGSDALAAVGACSSPYAFVTSLVLGFANGSGVIIAQIFGSGDREKLRRSYITGCKVIFITGICFTLIGLLVTRPLLFVMQTPNNVFGEAVSYMMIMCAGILATCLYNMMAAFLRAVGNSVVPLIALIISSLINIVLDLAFVLAAGMDVKGVALATVLAQLISGIYCLVYLRRKMPELKFTRREFKIDRSMSSEMVRIAIPAAFSTSIVSLSTILIQSAVNLHGSTVMAAYTAGLRAEQVCTCLAYSIGQATGVFCGQNIGAGDQKRTMKGLHAGLLISLIYTLIMGALLYVCGGFLIGLFSTSAEVIEIGTGMVRVTALFVPVLGLLFCFQHFLRNVSDVRPTVWMSCCEIAARGILPFVFSSIWGYAGIWWATPVGWSSSLLIGILRYRSGKWKQMAKFGKKEIVIEQPSVPLE